MLAVIIVLYLLGTILNNMRSNPSAFEAAGANGDGDEPPDERPIKLPHR